MKITTPVFAAAAFMGLSIATITAPFALAEPPVREITKTTTTTGIVSEFGAGRMVVRSETEKTPLGYTFTKTTTYEDEAGNPVSVETVKSGLPVTVHYTMDGDRMLARRVIVRRMPARDGGAVVEQRTTTTTNTLGTISKFGQDDFFIQSETSPEPIRYLYSTKTRYVDENGAPISVETVRSGLPVTVYYTREGDRMNATKVIVRKAANPEVIIQKKTTTITEEKK